MSPKATPPYIASRQGCNCSNPLADPREMCCVYCGHQIDDAPTPSRSTLSTTVDRSTFARKRKYRAAP